MYKIENSNSFLYRIIFKRCGILLQPKPLDSNTNNRLKLKNLRVFLSLKIVNWLAIQQFFFQHKTAAHVSKNNIYFTLRYRHLLRI